MIPEIAETKAWARLQDDILGKAMPGKTEDVLALLVELEKWLALMELQLGVCGATNLGIRHRLIEAAVLWRLGRQRASQNCYYEATAWFNYLCDGGGFYAERADYLLYVEDALNWLEKILPGSERSALRNRLDASKYDFSKFVTPDRRLVFPECSARADWDHGSRMIDGVTQNDAATLWRHGHDDGGISYFLLLHDSKILRRPQNLHVHFQSFGGKYFGRSDAAGVMTWVQGMDPHPYVEFDPWAAVLEPFGNTAWAIPGWRAGGITLGVLERSTEHVVLDFGGGRVNTFERWPDGVKSIETVNGVFSNQTFFRFV